MIDKIHISGLKSVDTLEIGLKNFNLFLGVNSAGKSTIIQGLLTLSQSINQQEYKLNGSLVSLGEFREVRNFITNAKSIKINVTDSKRNHSIEYFEESEPTVDIKKNDCEFIFDKGLYYLSASRIGHMDTYEKNTKEVYKYGLKGEYCFSYFLKHKDRVLERKMLRDSISETLAHNVNLWFDYIVGGRLVVNDIPQTDRIKAQFKGRSDREVRTKNIGSGLSYLISIIIMCLSLEKGETLIIENPEIHLHPKSQSRLTEFFMFIANADRQLIIETHSDHIFNGTRVAISNGNIGEEKVSINFFSLDDQSYIISDMDKLINFFLKGENPGDLSKTIEGRLKEFRTSLTNNRQIRFFYFEKGKKIIFMNGFLKKTEKTPPNEIDRAKRIMSEY